MADKGATSKTARISVVCTPAMRDAFFDWCRHQSPRRSMSDHLAEFIRERLGWPDGADEPPADDGKSTPKRRSPQPPAPADRAGKGKRG